MNVYFFYPSKIVGGAEFLFMRCAEYLAANYNLSIKYIDYEDGFVKSKLSENSNIEIVLYKQFSKIRIQKNSIVVAPLSSCIEMSLELVGDFRIFYWSIHPVGLQSSLNSFLKFSFLDLKDYKNDLQKMIDLRSIAFMDGANLDYQRNLFDFTVSSEDFLPICCLSKDIEKLKVKEKTESIHLGWLGRLCIEKVNPLINIIEHGCIYVDNNPEDELIFHIVGEGDAKYLLEDMKLPKNVKLLFIGTLIGDHLYAYLNKEIDLMFAMGTSTLEIATLEKAVVLVDYSYEKMTMDNKFRWLYESKRFSVGDRYSKNNHYLHSFEELVRCIKSNELDLHAKKCYAYVSKNHSIEAVCNKLYLSLLNCGFTNSELEKTKFSRFKIVFFLKRLNRFRKKFL